MLPLMNCGDDGSGFRVHPVEWRPFDYHEWPDYAIENISFERFH
jgi:hypothetical protein